MGYNCLFNLLERVLLVRHLKGITEILLWYGGYVDKQGVLNEKMDEAHRQAEDLRNNADFEDIFETFDTYGSTPTVTLRINLKLTEWLLAQAILSWCR